MRNCGPRRNYSIKTKGTELREKSLNRANKTTVPSKDR